MRDYAEWHRAHDDPDSPLSWRLGVVRRLVAEALDRHPGAIRLVSACSGDGRDVLDVLTRRPDAGRVRATLVEVHPGIARAARDRARTAGLAVEVRTADAGRTDTFVDAVPADVLLLVGIFGNVSAADIARTVAAVPRLCASGATVLWTRRVDGPGGNDGVRALFADAGCAELEYVEHGSPGGPAVGAVRFAGTPSPLAPGETLFTFQR